jgi:large-conductance mechanosensitive channel
MSDEKPKTKGQKAVGILLNTLAYAFFAVCIAALFLSVTAKKDSDGAVNLWGRQLRVVVSDSMAKCDETDVGGYDIKDIPIRSMLLIELVPENEAEAEEWYAGLKVGDVLTFRYVYVRRETITHRITEITPKETGGYIIKLEGDNKASDADTLTQTIDTSLTDSPNYVIGKVTGQSLAVGLFITALKSPVGIVCIVIIPCIIIAVFEIIRLINALTENRKKREREEQKKRDEEFEEMKRQLELLQQQQTSQNAVEYSSDALLENRADKKTEEDELNANDSEKASHD